jgi:hypothetical protein
VTDRGKVELLLARDSELYDAARRLDAIEWAVEDERLLQYRATKDRLDRLGFDVTNYRPPLRPHRSERRTEAHVTTTDDVEQLITAAKRAARPSLDDLYREHIAGLDDSTPAARRSAATSGRRSPSGEVFFKQATRHDPR